MWTTQRQQLDPVSTYYSLNIQSRHTPLLTQHSAGHLISKYTIGQTDLSENGAMANTSEAKNA